MESDVCLKCRQPLEDIVQQCPRCGVALVYCSACGRAITVEVPVCPHCQAVNLEYVKPAAPEAPPLTPALSPASSGGEGVRKADPDQRRLTSAATASKTPEPLEAPATLGALAGKDIGMPPALGAGLLEEPPLEVLAGTGLGPLPFPSDPLGALSQPAGDAPFLLETDDALTFEANSHGAVQLRWRPLSLPPGSTASILVSASAALGLKTQEPLTLEVKSTAESRELPPWECLPTGPGSLPVQVRVEVWNATGEMVGCWQGSSVVRVARPGSVQQVNIHGDVVDISSGGGGLAEMLGLGGGGARRKWRAIPCYPEPRYLSRLTQSRPAPLEPPALPEGFGAGSGTIGASLRLTGQGQFARVHVKVLWAAQATIGRSPGPNEPPAGTDYQLRGDSVQDEDRRRISGRHLSLRLHQGRAWVQDVSTNGTWLNGRQLVKGRWYPLVSDDVLSLSQRRVAQLKAYLAADRQGVTALCLAQHRADGATACFVLAQRWLFWPATGLAGWPVAAGALSGVWLAERPTPDGRSLGVRATNEGRWLALGGKAKSCHKCGWQIEI